MTRKLLANNLVLVCAATLCLGVGVMVSIAAKNFTWLGRFSSIVVGLGIVLLSRPVISGSSILIEIEGVDGGLINRGSYYRDRGEQVPDHIHESDQNKLAASIYGPAVTMIGTIIWGFGDLLNGPLDWP